MATSLLPIRLAFLFASSSLGEAGNSYFEWPVSQQNHRMLPALPIIVVIAAHCCRLVVDVPQIF